MRRGSAFEQILLNKMYWALYKYFSGLHEDTNYLKLCVRPMVSHTYQPHGESSNKFIFILKY